ncbi:synaptic vesicle 2-related protein-like [Sycon ciliatum]|uniref:synaptic vesicle 2-related protein-like n=2 Tax=Sycon ciliatum TaxID=27933 RepID=UPI0020AAC781|eukprot:scpid40154/ scgid34558/ Synaptic vesicle 2-related protein
MENSSGQRTATEEPEKLHQEDFQREADSVPEKLRLLKSTGGNAFPSEDDDEDDEVASADEGAYYTVADALDRIGVGRFHYKLLVVVSIISVAGGLGSTGFALFPPLARCHLGLRSIHEAFLTSAPLVGAAIGGVALGYVATRWGRRTELIIMMVWTSFFGFLSAAAPTYWWLITLRVLVGFGHGGTGQRLSILFEYLPKKDRTLGAGVLTFCWNIGNFLEAVLIKFLIPTGVAWRLILIADAFVFGIALLFFKWLPESCFYLMARGQRTEALRLLTKAATENNKKLPIGTLVTADEKEKYMNKVVPQGYSETRIFRRTSSPPPLRQSQKKSSPLRDLFRPLDMCVTTILLSVAWFALAVAVVGCAILTEELLQMRQSLGTGCHSTFELVHGDVCEELGTTDYTPILLIFAAEFPALFLTYYSAGILGRRKALALSYALSAIFFGLLIICPLSSAWMTAFLAGARMSVTTAFSLMIIYTPEVYPTSVRGMAVGASRALYRLGSAGVPFLSQVLLRKSVVGSKAVHTAVTLTAAFICLLLPIETRNRQLGE